MTLRLMQVAAILVLAACGTAPSQSSAQQASSTKPFTETEVTRFEAPWAMDFLPGSGVATTKMALVTEKGGKLWLLDTATGRKQEVAGVPSVHVAGQGGLGDVVAHPGFAGNQRVYLSYIEPGPGGTSGAVIGYGRLLLGQGQPRLEGFKVIWRQSPKVTGNGHFSHRIAFAPDGSMFISSGDRQKFDPAQDAASDLGKIIHMTDQGQRIGGHHYSMGHRNVLGLAFAPDGRLWETEMGPQGGDEVNLIVEGKNYGWPRASYGSHYGGGDIPDDHKGRGFEEPKVWWNPSISPGGLLIYAGDLFPQWKGDALIPALSGQALIRVDIDGDQARKADQWDMGARVRAVDQGPEGEVYLLEDGDSGGRLLKLTPAN
ncbi:PQQ-dependent sugar dehydrogenase [Sphingomonas daechungensis]|uniref:PQQ-dependent sugar dehydrogenase n=1 Tax=Sphingomonas daechungensis TaxID=1176646 RepID=UPI0031EE9E07